jgi:hypothetical protein
MLRLDFIPTGSDDCPLLRISGSDKPACKALHDSVVQLAERATERVAIEQLPGVVSVGGCRLSVLAGSWDQGVLRCGDGPSFEWVLTPDTWDNIAGLLEPFCGDEQSGNHQWLQSAGDIRVVITKSGDW